MLNKYSFCTFLITVAIFLSCDPALAAKDPSVYFKDGLKYTDGNDMKKAKKSFQKAIKLSPSSYPSNYNLGLIFLQEMDYESASKYLKEAKKLNPFDIRIDAMLSSTYFLLGNYQDSKKHLSEIIAKKPTDIVSHKKLGLLYLRENNVNSALAEFSLTKNLSPSDVNSNLLLSAAYAQNNNFSVSLNKIKTVKSQLSRETDLAFYAYILEKNNMVSESNQIYNTISLSKDDNIISIIISDLEERTIFEEIKNLTFIENFENPAVSKRIAAKLRKQEERSGVFSSADEEEIAKRPFGLKGKMVQNFEFYDRSTKASSPINSLNVTSNVKIEGKTENDVAFSGEAETFYNRWDNTELDFYKINVNKRDNYEVDVGKFSPKHFRTLVSYPTVEDGLRIWKKFSPEKFQGQDAPEITLDPGTPINVGEIFRIYHVDNRKFKSIEITAVAGRTFDSINIGERKEKNEGSFESSGQFEQWTQSYRIHSQLNRFLELGSSFAFTQDRSRQATVNPSSVQPVESMALGIDGGIDLLDNDLNIDGELAYANFDPDTLDMTTKHQRDLAWIFKTKYKMFKTSTFSYEQKTIGRNFEVEGASQTKDKTTHTLDWVYKPQKPRTWFIQSQTIKFKPEIQSANGGGSTKKRFKTFQTITEFKLPQNAKYTFDYKYYDEQDKCGCTDYTTLTFENSLNWKIQGLDTTIKPSYTFERKDDKIAAPTDEKKKEYALTIENTSIKNLKLSYSWERERKKFTGLTTKSYLQYINSFEAKYSFIPSRFDMKVKASQDYKDPSDTNKTDIATFAYELNYISKDRDNTLNFKFERKNNIYRPWADNSAYRQNYGQLKYTRKF